jgi:hypothetical protein
VGASIRHTEDGEFTIEKVGVNGIRVRRGTVRTFYPRTQFNIPEPTTINWTGGAGFYAQAPCDEVYFLHLEFRFNQNTKKIYLKMDTGAAFGIAGYVDIGTSAGDSNPFYHFGIVEDSDTTGTCSHQGALAQKAYAIGALSIICQTEDPEKEEHSASKNEDKSLGDPFNPNISQDPTHWTSVTHILIGEITKEGDNIKIKQFHQGPIYFQPPEPVYYGDAGQVYFGES